MTPDERPPHYRLRLILGIALAAPVPMIILSWFIYLADDFRQTPAWARDWMIYALPVLSIVGFAILPLRVLKRALLGCLMVPVITLFLFVWAMIFACYAFGDCIKSLV
ncbi:hypothetical protein FPZ24_12340 [Sphingomonas panacisoli]|uniref:Uncharacterized protein n=1 Tax=Sphingomonas panacisoli TaxID=1813879 RepID=A0A5B8LM48_9SPHN|nr:hypothetical protein [Sphingomonas panacisoli]QDZ08170.1 hypothetical protein FPZ24_12340 [Sphingomonas panacisoli]